jgi:hypothetical protein
LKELPQLQYLNEYMGQANIDALEKSPHSYTLMTEEDERVVGCAGVVEYWSGRGEAWAILDTDSRHEFLAMHNTVKRFLDVCPVNRIEAAVDLHFDNGHRWVMALGFRLDAARLRAFFPNGRDASLYSRVRE